ncbi:PREDICTED: uncharacterized protein LOC106809619 isoform X2 [Priapulus caudatus]|uniref:Uncharacterized protein LOC106809619 isoform X2 n=1 Tax=Priapulus caudatus TaxID=37621 RepID=A0ABM1E7T6_PRICU|nr:PREDICTED: uncharacterized protein LOC106809619 isoform X2 [Priapulus caudatus]
MELVFVLEGILPTDYLIHFGFLSASIRLLSKDCITVDESSVELQAAADCGERACVGGIPTVCRYADHHQIEAERPKGGKKAERRHKKTKGAKTPNKDTARQQMLHKMEEFMKARELSATTCNQPILEEEGQSEIDQEMSGAETTNSTSHDPSGVQPSNNSLGSSICEALEAVNDEPSGLVCCSTQHNYKEQQQENIQPSGQPFAGWHQQEYWPRSYAWQGAADSSFSNSWRLEQEPIWFRPILAEVLREEMRLLPQLRPDPPTTTQYSLPSELEEGCKAFGEWKKATRWLV